MKYVPAWFPGAHFQRQARKWRQPIENVRDRPFNAVKARMVRLSMLYQHVSKINRINQAQGDAPDCAAKALLNTMELNADAVLTEDDIKGALATMYAGGHLTPEHNFASD